MVEKPEAKKPESAEILVNGIKTEIDRLLQNNAFYEQDRKSRPFDLDSQALANFSNLPVNTALISDVKMLLSVSRKDTIKLNIEHKDRQEGYSFQEPQTLSFQLNFRNKNVPHTTFIYYLHIRDGQTARPYLTQQNNLVPQDKIEKASIRASANADLLAIKNLLRGQN